MHILIIGLNFAPEPTGVGKYSGEMTDWLARRGHSVSVVAAPPYYPFWKIAEGYRFWGWRRERMAGSDVVRCPLFVPAHPTGTKRSLHLASFGISSFPAGIISALRQKPDIVAAIVPTLCAAPTALAAARLSGARSWIHVQDLEVDAAFDLGILQKAAARKTVLAIERALLSRFDLVSTISEVMRDRIIAKGIPGEKLALFPNWVDVEKIRPTNPNLTMRRELGIPDGRVIALYSGSMGEKHGLESIIEAAQKSVGTRLHFVIAGDGPGKMQLEEMAASLPNVTLLPLQPAETLNEFLSIADIHLLPQRADAAELVMPSKLGAMLASGRPIVAMVTANSQVGRLIAGCGLVTPPADAAALVVALQKLVGNVEELSQLGKAARETAMALAQDKVLGDFEARLIHLLQKRNGRSV
jgi:colanic acid biosynthesis glycosyl transferase WcaI